MKNTLSNLTLLLLVAVAMLFAGCVAPAQYTKVDDPFKSLSSKSQRLYASAKLCLMLTENSDKAVNLLRETKEMKATWGADLSDIDPKQRVAELTELFTSRFRETIRVKSLDDVQAHKCNLTLSLDIQITLGWYSFMTNTAEISGTFIDDKGGRLDTLSGAGKSTMPYIITTYNFSKAWNQALTSFGENMDNSKSIASFVAGLPQYVEPATTMAAPSVAPASIDLAFWDSIKSSTNPVDFQSYLREFPNGSFKSLARSRLAALGEPVPADVNLLPSLKSDVDELPAIKAKPNKNAYAIVIGIENYRQKLPKADFAAADAKTMTEYLTKVMGYPEENIVTLTNEHATNVDFAKYFEKWLLNNVEKDGSVFIYYSGHGAPNPKTGDAYLVPYDGDPSFIDQTGYSLKRLYESLGKLQAKEIIVTLDSCFSGAGGKSVIAKGAKPLVMNLEHDITPVKNMTVLSASSGDQISSSYEEKGHGLFTYFMLKGLKGEGDANGDGSVEIGELFNYIKPQVERIARKVYNNEQSPQLIAPLEKQKMFLIEKTK